MFRVGGHSLKKYGSVYIGNETTHVQYFLNNLRQIQGGDSEKYLPF